MFNPEAQSPSAKYWTAVEDQYSQIGNIRKGTIKNAYTYACGKNGEFFSTCIKPGKC